MKNIKLCLIICTFSLIAANFSLAKNVLCISETTETTKRYYYNDAGAYMYLMERYFSPERILDECFNVTQVNWSKAQQHLNKCENYDAVILWEAPCYIKDSRNDDPYHKDVDVINEQTAEKIVDYVKNGGALVVAGGVVNYGNGHPLTGASTDAGEGKRKYIGYRESPLRAVLPLEIRDDVTIAAMDREQIQKTCNSELLDSINLKNWPANAYHKTRKKKGAENLALLDNLPLISRWQVNEGRVAAVTAAPRANILVKNEKNALNPIWSKEAVLWDRIIRWAMGIPFQSSEKEAQLVQKYKNLASGPQELPFGARLGEYPYIAHVLDAAMPDNILNLNYKYINDLNFNNVVMQGYHSIGKLDYQDTPESLLKWCKEHTRALEENNLSMIARPAMAESVKFHIPDPNQWAQKVLPSGEFASHYGGYKPCPYNKYVQKYAKEQMKQYMPVLSEFQRIRGIVPEDEWAWTLGYRNPYEGGQGIGCYSPWVNKRFKKLTGKEAPAPEYKEKGYIAPEDDLWLKWCELIRQDAYEEYNEMVTQTARSYREDFLVSNYPGGFEGNTGLMIEEVYLDCWRESPLLAIERMDVRSNFRMDSSRTELPVWAMVGIFRMPEDKSIYPETLRLTTGVCLGSGAKGIILWNYVNLWGQYFQHPGHAWLESEAEAIGDYLHKFGPMFLELEKEPADMWILSGWFWVNSFDNYLHIPPEETSNYNKETPWWNIHISEIAGPAAMRAGIYPEFVTEKQLMSKELFKQEAVMLPGAIYSRQGVVDNINKYIEKGGKVYLDQSAEIEIPGAETLPVDFSKWHQDIAEGKRPTQRPTEENYKKQRKLSEEHISNAVDVLEEHVTPQVSPNIEIDSTESAYTLLANGRAKYLFVYNADERNQNTFNVTCRNLPNVVYDIEKSELVSEGQNPISFSLSLPPGGWKVFALCENQIGSLKVQKADIEGDKLNISAEIYSENEGIFDAAVPVKIILYGEENKTHEFYRSTSRGKLNIEMPFGKSIPKPVKVEMIELFEKHKCKNIIGN
ncbi:putative membrane protein [Sedimentisphaera salicampi]|nr:putative membrane protein [Sedimentisphaera salicampi]